VELKSISRYRILERLGAGGMGEVFLAEDTRLGRKVALKLLAQELTQNRDRLNRFDQEAYAASSLNHPNILTIYEMGDENGRHFIVTEFVDGVTLRKRLGGAPMELLDVLDVAIQIASALEEAHAAGIVHRDIKPENIMIRRNGHVKVLDFGLAKLTERALAEETDKEAVTRALVQTDANVVLGTSQYMSPEQARGKPVDGRTDIWSLGVVLYEMVAGRAPFSGETTTDIIISIAKTEPQPLARFAPSVPAEFEWIVMKALRKNVDERYQTIKEVESDLKSLKQRLVFRSELERSMPPEKLSDMLSGSRLALSDTDITSATRMDSAISPPLVTSGTGAVQTRASSAEYVVSEIKRHRKSLTLAAAGVLVAVLALGLWWFWPRQVVLTDKDAILVADFTNTTGDSVFDGALKQALAVQLEQSPFLDIVSEDRVRDALRFMEKSPDERITREVAREICQRHGIKAMLLGSISGIGNHYAVSLDAVNAQTGDSLASEHFDSDSREQVLKSLGQAAARLREKLGESLSSIERFNAPIEQVTTSQFDALKQYSLGIEQHSQSKYREAIPFYKQAIEIDPKFAIAYARLATCYNNIRQYELSREASQRAYEYRDRASQREKLLVSWSYYGAVTGEWDRTNEQLEVWKSTYPRDWEPFNLLANRYTIVGPFDSAITNAREALRLNPKDARAYVNLAVAYMGLGRLAEAKGVLRQAQDQKLETTNMHLRLFQIAFIEGDTAGMTEQLNWAGRKPDDANQWQAQIAEFSGDLTKANEFWDRVVESTRRSDAKELTSQVLLQQAWRNAAASNCANVPQMTKAALGMSREQANMTSAALSLAACNQASAAQALIDELAKQFPLDSLLNSVSIPLVRAQLELNRGNASPAINLLESARKFEVYGEFWPQYVRALAYLKEKNGSQAAAEFQTIIDHRGWYPLSPLYPLAHLGLARAAALSGDTSKARKSYQDFFTLWKDADSANRVLNEARAEYDKLK
jgi:serine/threonine protein kinase/tetratricopeptide (TPR) repeat protein